MGPARLPLGLSCSSQLHIRVRCERQHAVGYSCRPAGMGKVVVQLAGLTAAEEVEATWHAFCSNSIDGRLSSTDGRYTDMSAGD